MPAYLDHAASTPMRPAAVEAMLPWLRDHCANPSGVHTAARAARRAIDEARDTMAEVLGAEPREVVFTSGGTEADNLAVLGVHDRVGGVVACSAIEHHAVLDAVEGRKGRLLPVGADGVVDVDALVALLDEVAATGGRVSLVSIMLVNNEVGVVQPLARLAKRIRRHAPDALIHTDAVQAMPTLDVAALAAPADLVSVSAHKFGGPKGAGVLVVRERATDRLSARAVGGGQERERRSGTQNVPAIAGMATAARQLVERRAREAVEIARLRDRLVAGLVTGFGTATRPPLVFSGATGGAGVPQTVNVCFEGVESESLLYLLERAEVFASAGASCASGAMEPSHVLAAMGVPRPLALGALRLSLGWSSTDEDVDAALAAIAPAVARLREFA